MKPLKILAAAAVLLVSTGLISRVGAQQQPGSRSTALSDSQKKTADQLFWGHMGMMM